MRRILWLQLQPHAQTVRRSVMTLTMEPGPAISTSCAWLVASVPMGRVLVGQTRRGDISDHACHVMEGGRRTFSCQLSKTLMAWPPPSPPPREWICEKPVG